MTFFFAILLRASAVVAIGWVAHAVFARTMSAAARHFVLTLVVYALLLLPLFSLVLPAWPLLEIPTDPTVQPVVLVETMSANPAMTLAPVAVDPSPGRAASWISWPVVLAAVYATGVLLLLVRLMVERLSLQKLARRASAVRDSNWTDIFEDCARRVQIQRPIRLLRSSRETVPMAFGLTRPAILIPASADGWPQGRRQAVLLHEMAHIARNDCFTQMLAAVSCAIYWIHPMVWWVAKRLRIERELACDDRVLALGAEPREYAEDLLELAYTLGRQPPPALAVTMASSRQIEGRMLAVLDESRNRATPSSSMRTAAGVLSIALTVPIAAATTTERPVASPPAKTVAQPLAFSQRTPPAAPQDTGTWEIRVSDARTVHLRMTEGDGSHGTTIDVDQLSGLPTTLMTGAAGAARFSLRRDAGTFNFDGVFRNGVGGGTYTFAPNPEFPDAFAKRGYARPTPAEQHLFARANFSVSVLDELASQGYARPDMAQLIRAVQHGVSLTYLRDMGQLGYRLKVIDALITLRNHGVSPQYVRDLAAEGLKGLSADELVRARTHGVSPEYVRELRAFGHQGLTLDALTRLRGHGVSPRYLQELAALGYDKLPLDVTIQMRNHGVSPEYVRDLRAQGYSNLQVESLIRLRNHGVSPEYVRELSDLGYTGLTIDDLVGLRNHGISAERIRQANSRAGKRLTIDALKTAAAHGWR